MSEETSCIRLNVDSEIELKQLELLDAMIIFNTIDSQREYLGKWLPFVESTKDLSDTISYVESILNTPDEKLEYVFTILKQNTFVGLIGLKDIDQHNKRAEIGYWLSDPFQKQGIITKSASKLCDFAFNVLDLNRIQIKVATENLPSKNIANKLGFTFEGIERQGIRLSENYFSDLAIFSKLKSDL